MNPLEAIQVGLTREPEHGPGTAPWLPDERADLPSLLAAYTIEGAYLAHLEKETGSLELGKSADLVVLDGDLFQVAPRQIHELKVLLTVLAGDVVYDLMSPAP